MTRRAFLALSAAALLTGTAAGCSAVATAAPACDEVGRLALVAQSVPSAAYLPCVGDLRPGWSVTAFDARTGSTTFDLLSDRAQGRTVAVRLGRTCDTRGATPEPPRSEGGRTFLRLSSIEPRYAGTLLDVFAGGCVTYRFDFVRGPHIALMEDLTAAVQLVPRRQLRLEVREQLGEELDP